jgi:hypothetical protein
MESKGVIYTTLVQMEAEFISVERKGLRDYSGRTLAWEKREESGGEWFCGEFHARY